MLGSLPVHHMITAYYGFAAALGALAGRSALGVQPAPFVAADRRPTLPPGSRAWYQAPPCANDSPRSRSQGQGVDQVEQIRSVDGESVSPSRAPPD